MDARTLLEHRIIFLGRPVDADAANEVVASLLLLNAQDAESPIDLYINSPGGSVVDGLAIIDAMLCSKAPVKTICIGQAASMAASILAAGEPGLRLASPNAEIMLHQIQAGFAGQLADVQARVDRLMRLHGRMVQLLAGWTGRPAAQIAVDLGTEQWMSADEALGYGLVDAVLQPTGAAQ